MAKYNLPRAPKSIEKRFVNAYRDQLNEIGVTEQDIQQRGVPDFDKVKPPSGGYWGAGVVGETGEALDKEAMREFYDKPLIAKKETSAFPIEPPKPEPKKPKKPKQRKRFTATGKPSKAVGEDISSLFKTAAAFAAVEVTPEKLVPPTKEPVTPPISNIVEEIKPKQKTGYPKLPAELAKVTPKYKPTSGESLPIYFSNDIDKAAYIITGKAKKETELRNKLIEWISKVTDWEVRQIAILGLEIRSQIKDFYSKANQSGDFFIQVPDFYTKMKSEIDSITNDDLEEEELPEGLDDLLAEVQETPKYDFPGYSYSQFLEKYGDKPKKKRTKRSPGQLTKKQEEILHNILQDLIKIKFHLTEIKANQEAKIAYEKRRDRLNAERLAFLEREKEIEALPSKESKSPTTKSGKKTEKKGGGFLDALKDIVKAGIVSAIGGLIFGGGGDQNNNQNKPNNNATTDNTPPKQLAEGGIVGPTGLLPFADGGSITPLESDPGTSIDPLGTSPVKATAGGTTYSRGFSVEDLKSPLAEVMKLPLKVAGAALLSAISKMASQFDIDDPKLTSDLSKMINDVSRAFGLVTPTFATPGAGKSGQPTAEGTDSDQHKLATDINSLADSLKPDATKKDDTKKDDPNKNKPPGTPAPTTASSTTAPATSTTPPPPATTGAGKKETTPTPLTPSTFHTNPSTSLPSESGPDIHVASASMGGSTTNLGIGGSDYSSSSSSFNPSFSSANASFNSTLNNPSYSQSNTFANNFTAFNPGSTKSIFSNGDLNYNTSMNFDVANMSSSGRVPSSYYAYLGLAPNDSYESIMSPEDSKPIVLPPKIMNQPQINTIPEGPIRMSKRPSGFNCYATNIFV